MEISAIFILFFKNSCVFFTAWEQLCNQSEVRLCQNTQRQSCIPSADLCTQL